MSAVAANSPRTSGLYSVLGWLVTLLTPVVLVLTAVRLLMMPAFLSFEYNTPNFPADLYGFTQADRLYWSNIALDYLMNDAGIEFLGDLRFDDGSPVYNARELGHMVDVKIALGNALQVWRISLGALVLLAIWAWLGGWIDAYRHGLGRGGWLTAIAIAGIILFVLAQLWRLLCGLPQRVLRSGHLDVRVQRYPDPPLPGALLARYLYLRGRALRRGRPADRFPAP